MRDLSFPTAIHILVAIARHESTVHLMTSQQLAETVNTNSVVIRRLLKKLSSAGLISIDRGRSGGVSLLKKPAQISLAEIYQATESAPAIACSNRLNSKTCPLGKLLTPLIKKIQIDVEANVLNKLAEKNLAQLLKDLSKN